MSLEQSAFIDRSRVPDRESLERAIRTLGFDLRIDESYKPFESSGFLPCMLKGEKSGFEIYFESPIEAIQAFPHLKEEVGSRDCTIGFRWGGNMSECACVMIVSAALAKDIGAIVHYRDDDMLYSVEGLLKDAAIALSDISSRRNQVTPRQSAPQGMPWWRFW